MSTGPGVEAVAEARPVEAGERLEVLDVLRGFALGGVFVSNVYVWMSGWVLMPRSVVKEELESSWVDQAANELFQFFVNGRFMPIFSFLFGLGFCVQLTRAEKRGTSVVPVYTRRLMAMYLLGLVHVRGGGAVAVAVPGEEGRDAAGVGGRVVPNRPYPRTKPLARRERDGVRVSSSREPPCDVRRHGALISGP
ncbi:MAG TPA: hypothetical protein VFZ09_42530 [Archangium sp.]|uniref:DUF418 domain-containing protein n=1 Tax=Archangium sp. TaxID=1872627 RepID=UPI002E3210F5|nr:hypothetical protein [Archangium sp.]HEX5752957.1 hypothetical protein [Archangium sp.]